MLPKSPEAIARKWVATLGMGFHPDTPADDYEPALTAEQAAEYEADMDELFALSADPYELCISAMVETISAPEGEG